MREKPPQIGNTPEEIGREDISSLREKYLQFLPGEIEKTPEEIRFILKANEWLRQEFKELNIENIPPDVMPEQVHILSTQGWNDANGPDNKDNANCSADASSISINSERTKDRSKRMAILLHEIIHLQSHHKFFTGKDSLMYPYRDGMPYPKIRTVW